VALSTDRILNSTVTLLAHCQPDITGNHLDIGSGHGDLIRLMRERFAVTSSACDYTDALMQLPDQRVDIVDLNEATLPYPDAHFAVVTCTEVIEHVENHRRLLRECHRVLQPGGLLVVSTPNILNLSSRVRFLLFGFWNLFGPLPVAHRQKQSTSGHINPISSFYLSHALLEAGFLDLRIAVDKRQRTSLLGLVVFGLPILLFGTWLRRRERTRYRTLDDSNRALVERMNSLDLLLGRTILVTARKP